MPYNKKKFSKKSRKIRAKFEKGVVLETKSRFLSNFTETQPKLDEMGRNEGHFRIQHHKYPDKDIWLLTCVIDVWAYSAGYVLDVLIRF